MKRILILLMIVLGSIQLFAQNKNIPNDKLMLKDGSILYGQILNYEIGGNIEFKLNSGRILTFSSNEIKKIEMHSDEKETIQAKYEFKHEVYYNNFSASMISGSSSANNSILLFRTGVGLYYALGYRYNDFLSVGLGTGIETYSYGLRELFVPIHFDYMAFLKKSKVSPFVRLQAGYGFLASADENVIEKNGGLNFCTGFGIKYPGYDSLDYLFDINFKYQKAYFVYHTNTWSDQISYRDIIFRRISFRIGILF